MLAPEWVQVLAPEWVQVLAPVRQAPAAPLVRRGRHRMVHEQESPVPALTAQKQPDRLLQAVHPVRNLRRCLPPGGSDHPQSEPERLVAVARRRFLNIPDTPSVELACNPLGSGSDPRFDSCLHIHRNQPADRAVRHTRHSPDYPLPVDPALSPYNLDTSCVRKYQPILILQLF